MVHRAVFCSKIRHLSKSALFKLGWPSLKSRPCPSTMVDIKNIFSPSLLSPCDSKSPYLIHCPSIYSARESIESGSSCLSQPLCFFTISPRRTCRTRQQGIDCCQPMLAIRLIVVAGIVAVAISSVVAVVAVRGNGTEGRGHRRPVVIGPVHVVVVAIILGAALGVAYIK